IQDRGTKIPVDGADIASMLLSADKVKERAELIAQGFPGWTRGHYYSFIDGMAVYGRDRLELVATMVGKPAEEVVRYGEAFWRQGPKTFSEEAWRRIKTRVETKEKRLNELNRIMMVTNELTEAVDDPWRNMEVRINQRQGGAGTAGMQLQREWTKDEDRYLLCLTHLCGWGNWRKVRACILASPRFTFDYYLRSLSETALGKHCEQLMKSSEKYLQDLQDRMKKEAKREMEDRGALEKDEAAAAREDEEFKLRIRAADNMLGTAERELAEAESNKRNLEMIAEAIKSGTVSLDNPNVRSLLESCASNGIGTTGLNTKNAVKKSAEGVAGAGAGGRKSPGVGGKKSASPGGGGQKKAVASKAAVPGNTGNGGGKKTSAASSGTPAAAANGDAKKSGGGGGKGKGNAVAGKKADTTSSDGKGKVDAGKGGVKSPKAASSTSNAVDKSPANSSGTKAKRTPTKSVGKPGLEVPKTLFPELVRLLEKGDLTSKDDMLQIFQKKHPAFTQVSINKAIGVLGEKVSRGSKWKVLDAGKKYLSMPVYQGNVPEEVAVLSALSAKRKSGGSESHSAKKRKSTTPSKAKGESKSPKPITNFFPPKTSGAADANGGGGGSAPSKKRKAPAPASPKS
ncbi:unnamed protein product, partial [Ectocarpus sp. 8 AP-2014]